MYSAKFNSRLVANVDVVLVLNFILRPPLQ